MTRLRAQKNKIEVNSMGEDGSSFRRQIKSLIKGVPFRKKRGVNKTSIIYLVAKENQIPYIQPSFIWSVKKKNNS